MRSKNPQIKNRLEQFIDGYFDENKVMPTLRQIESGAGISRQTALRYLKEMDEEGTIQYDRRKILTKHIQQRVSENTVMLPVIGTVTCGIPESQTESRDGFIELPVSFIGTGKYYVLRAEGKSMLGAGIDDGDLVVIRQTSQAQIGQIVVALDENNQNTLKRFAYDGQRQAAYLHPENEEFEDIYPQEIIIQGVAEKVIKDLI